MSDITIEPMDGGLQLLNGAVRIQATRIHASPTQRYAELRVMRQGGSPIYLPQRIDILNPQDVTQFLANLTVNEPGTNWDTILAQLGAALAALSDATPAGQEGVTLDGKPPMAAVLSHRALLEMDIPARSHLIGFLDEGALTLVYAGRGRGKTRFSLGLSIALVQGQSFLGWPCGQAAGVLYVDGEMPMRGLQDLVKKMSPTPLDDLYLLTSEHFFKTYSYDLRLTDSTHRQLIDRILDELPDVKLLVLDNISTLFSGISEDKKQDWEPINTWLIQLRHRGLAVILVHHAGKTGDQRGTSAREDILDTVIQLAEPPNYVATDGCHFYLHFTKSRFAAGDAVTSLDVRTVETDDAMTFVYQPVAEDHKHQVRNLLMEGVTRPVDIAGELGISKGYASKLKKHIETEG